MQSGRYCATAESPVVLKQVVCNTSAEADNEIGFAGLFYECTAYECEAVGAQCFGSAVGVDDRHVGATGKYNGSRYF